MSTLKANSYQHVDRASPSIIINSDGSVSISSTVTYEDVTSVDSVGIITARSTIDAQGDVSIADKIIHTGDTNTAIRFPAADTITAETGGSERLRITSTGKVGINSTVPGYTLDMTGDQMRLRSNSSGSNAVIRLWGQDANTGGAIIAQNSTGGAAPLLFYYSNTAEGFRIDSGGRILIGATASQDVYTTSTLQIQGTTAATTTMSLLGQGRSPYLSLGATGGSSLGAVTAVSSGDRLGQITFCGADGTDVNTHSCSVSGYCDGSVSSNAVPGRMVFKTSTGASEVERMRLHSGGQLSLGTTSGPGEIGLYLGDGSNPAGHIYANGTHHMYILANAYYNSGWKYLGNGEANSLTLQDGDFNFLNATANSSGAGQAVTLTSRMLIKASGRILIGGQSDSDLPGGFEHMVQVEGTGASSSSISIVRNSNDSNPPYLTFGKSRGTSVNSNTIISDDDDLGRIQFTGADGSGSFNNSASIRGQIDGTPGANDAPGRLVFFTTPDGSNSESEAVRIDCRGYVMLNGDTDTYVYHPAANTWAMVMAGSECFRWDNTHFGIGTTDIAGHHLSIHQGNSSEALIRFTNTTSGEGDGNGCYVGISNDEELELRNVENAGASLYTNNTQRFHVNNDGDVWFDRSVDGDHTVYIRNMSTTATSSSATTNILDFKFNRSGGGINLSAAKIVVGKEQEWVGAAANQDGYMCWHTAQNESCSEKMRLTSDGTLLIGTTTASTGAGTDDGGFINPYGRICMRRDDTMYIAKSIATGGYTAFEIRSAQTTVGSITFNSGGSSFNTTSDSRLKENVVDIDDGITRLKALKPKRFNYKSLPDVTQDGFIAHEAQEVLPYAVTGTKDEVATEDKPEDEIKVGDPIYQELDYSKLTPLLTAALQEAIGKIEVLEEKVAALEST